MLLHRSEWNTAIDKKSYSIVGEIDGNEQNHPFRKKYSRLP